MITSLILPTILTAVALFFASFLSWMILKLHARDWVKLDKEDDFLEALGRLGVERGSYMFPFCDPKDMKNEETRQKWEKGPRGILTIFPKVGMGWNMGLTFVYFLAISFCLGYVGTLALEPGAAFEAVFRVISTVGLLVFLAAIVQHAIWFHNRIVGHVIESILYAVIAGAIFGTMWPGA